MTDVEGSSRHLVLVVENDSDLLETIVTMLRYSDRFHGRGATTVDTALHELATRPLPSVILTDLWMTPKTGLDLREAVRKDGHLSNIPVLFMTGAEPTRTAGLELGTVLRKPFELSELTGILDRATGFEEAKAESTALT